MQPAVAESRVHFLLAIVAEAVNLLDDGAANFQRQLVKGDLSSEYENDIRLWLEQVG